ncbi:MAG: DNA repair protein RecN, partial [Gammaproteobacteria bacterium]
LLQVRNFAIIDELEVEFGNGLNVLTGETGAGKSILIDALGLTLGDRADQQSVHAGADKAEISALFECPEEHAALAWLREHDLDDDLNCSLRRVISAEGRSRAFVNNSPVTLQDLRELGSTLIEIHGQQAHQALMHTREQRRLLDAVAGNGDLVATTAQSWARWQAAREALDNFAQRRDDNLALLEMQKFQLTELEQLDLAEGEFENLLAEHHLLANVDDISRSVQFALEAAYDGEPSAHALVARAIEALEDLERDERIAGIAAQLRSVEIELRDAGTGLAHFCDTLEPDPARLAELESRLGRIRALARRHATEESALWQKTEQLRESVTELESSDNSRSDLERRASEAEAAYESAAGRLSKARRRHAARLATEVSDQLPGLGLRDGQFRISLGRRAQPDSTGIDDIEFQVRLNAGHNFGPLARVASGGELSRISLALQVAGGGQSSVPTFVFDEIDAGIGGGAAEIVGKRLRELAGQRQVLCVTHQAQVASRGHIHFRIEKSTIDRVSRTIITRLREEERVDELSRMIGGIEITAKAREHAEEMMTRAQAGP